MLTFVCLSLSFLPTAVSAKAGNIEHMKVDVTPPAVKVEIQEPEMKHAGASDKQQSKLIPGKGMWQFIDVQCMQFSRRFSWQIAKLSCQFSEGQDIDDDVSTAPSSAFETADECETPKSTPGRSSIIPRSKASPKGTWSPLMLLTLITLNIFLVSFVLYFFQSLQKKLQVSLAKIPRTILLLKKPLKVFQSL